MNQRGFAQDIIFIAVMILFFALSGLICWLVWDEFITNPTMVSRLSEAGITTELQPITEFYENLNTLIVVTYFLLNITAVILAVFIRTHPVFFALNFILILIFVMVSALIGNIYYEFASNSFIAPYANQLPLVYTMFEYMPVITLIFAGIIAVVMYGKGSAGGQYAY